MSEQTSPRTRQDIEAHIIAQAWKDEAYKQELLTNPKAVIGREFSVLLPEGMTVQVLEENPNNLYFVLPTRPDLSAAELSDEQLEAVAGGIAPIVVGAVAAGVVYAGGVVTGIMEGEAGEG